MESTELTLDPAAIARLHKIGGEDLVRQMTQLFLQNANRRLTAAREGFTRGDYEEIAKSMHALKSSAGNIGASRLGQMAIRAESMAEARIPDALADLLDQMDAEFEQVSKALESGKVQ